LNSGQQILTIFAIAILTILIINVYKSQSLKQEMIYSNEAILTGTDLAQSLLNEIEAKAFDEKTVSQSVSIADTLTSPDSLGAETGEYTTTQFDDIDDYNNYTRSDSLGKLGLFNLWVKVYYINKLSPDVESSTQTFSKQIDILLTNFSVPDTIRFHQVISY